MFTRSQYATAVKAAHDALHDAEETRIVTSDDYPHTKACVARAHEALHTVYDPQDPPIACASRDPEAMAIVRELVKKLDHPLPCGHTIGDLIGGPRSVTKCGECIAEKMSGTGRFAPDVQPEPPEAA